MSDQVINAPVEGGGITLLEPGQYLVYCYGIILLGEIPGFKDKPTRKILYLFETPNNTAVFNEDKGEQPFGLQEEFTHSMHKQSNMRGFVQNWAGKQFNDEQAARFNIVTLMNIPAIANIIHGTSKAGKEFMKIGSIGPAKGIQKLPNRHNKTIVWTWNEAFDANKFLTLPLWVRNKMITSSEFRALGVNIPMLNDEVWSQTEQCVVKSQQQAAAPQSQPQTQPQGPVIPGGAQAPETGQNEENNPFLNNNQGGDDDGFSIPQ